MYIIINRPAFLLINNYSKAPAKKYYSIEHKYHEERVAKQKEIDGILEKINKRGVNSLTKNEKESLDEYAKKSR
jgi:DNA-binding PadR family transcriptional regulator